MVVCVHPTPTNFQFSCCTAKEVFYAERVAELWQPAWQRATGFLRLIGTLTQDTGTLPADLFGVIGHFT